MQTPLSPEEQSRKEKEFDSFVDTLRRDLGKEIEKRREIATQIEEYDEVLVYIKCREHLGTRQDVKVDIGSGFMMDGTVDTQEPLMLSVGLDLFLELGDQEAVPLLIARQGLLRNRLGLVDTQIVSLQVKIDSFYQALAELKQLVV